MKIKNSLKILEFFLERLDDDLFLHFEVVPDHLPVALQEMITRFPRGSLQFEIGIQTFNQEVQTRISRRQNNEQAQTNLAWIRDHTQAYIHADLIYGLPGESNESFAESFNQLYSLRPHEIQVGILKRLKGSPIIRHTQAHQLLFNPNPPFSIVSSDTVSYQDVQAMNRFARYWDLIGNSGRFKDTLALLMGNTPFERFWALSSALFERSGQTHKISLLRLYDFVFDIAVQDLAIEENVVRLSIQTDFSRSGLKSIPKCLRGLKNGASLVEQRKNNKSHASRQSRH